MMKRVLICLLALLFCVPAMAETVLTKAELLPEGGEGYELAVNASTEPALDAEPLRREGELTYYAITEEDLKAMTESLLLLSVGPDGAVLMGDKGTYIVKRGNTLIMMQPEAGVSYPFDKMEQLMTRYAARIAGMGGIKWSADGRYICVCNSTDAIFSMQLIYDPAVWDTYTGEIITLENLNPKIREENNGGVIDMAFDRAGEYLYCVVMEADNGMKFTFRRYNLETRKGEILCEGKNIPTYPELFELEDGSWVMAYSGIKLDERDGYHVFETNGEWWSDWPKLLYAPKILYTVRETRASDSASVVVSRILLGGQFPGGLTILNTEGRWSGLGDVWTIPIENPASLVKLEIDPDAVKMEPLAGELSAQYRTIVSFDVSPDGTRALVLAPVRNEPELFLVDLETKQLTPVTAEGYAPKVESMMKAGNDSWFGWMDWYGESEILLGLGRGAAMEMYHLQ